MAVPRRAGETCAGKGLKAIDPERYGSLVHPGDAYAYDIYTQVAEPCARRRRGALGELDVEQLLAVGESQSAFALTTYVNGVEPLDPAVRRLPPAQPWSGALARSARPVRRVVLASSRWRRPRSAPTWTCPC